MQKALPLTPGLLISMSIRNDHSFGMLNNLFDSANHESLADKQTKLISQSFNEYSAYIGGEQIQGQRQEELEGNGFYAPERENQYRNWCQPEALHYAEGLCAAYNILGTNPSQ